MPGKHEHDYKKTRTWEQIITDRGVKYKYFFTEWVCNAFGTPCPKRVDITSTRMRIR